jgi:type I restriction enzyme R subunit
MKRHLIYVGHDRTPPDFANGILNAIMDALSAHSTMSEQVLDSVKVEDGVKDVLLGQAELYEALRMR